MLVPRCPAGSLHLGKIYISVYTESSTLTESCDAGAPTAARPLSLMPPPAVQPTLDVERIKQYPGQLQVDRRVMINAPGKFFPQLVPTDQAKDYPGEAVEFKERHSFPRHVKAWGGAHTGPGIRIICESSASPRASPLASPCASPRRAAHLTASSPCASPCASPCLCLMC
jgi:hypothetical protein